MRGVLQFFVNGNIILLNVNRGLKCFFFGIENVLRSLKVQYVRTGHLSNSYSIQTGGSISSE